MFTLHIISRFTLLLDHFYFYMFTLLSRLSLPLHQASHSSELITCPCGWKTAAFFHQPDNPPRCRRSEVTLSFRCALRKQMQIQRDHAGRIIKWDRAQDIPRQKTADTFILGIKSHSKIARQNQIKIVLSVPWADATTPGTVGIQSIRTIRFVKLIYKSSFSLEGKLLNCFCGSNICSLNVPRKC